MHDGGSDAHDSAGAGFLTFELRGDQPLAGADGKLSAPLTTYLCDLSTSEYNAPVPAPNQPSASAAVLYCRIAPDGVLQRGRPLDKDEDSS